MRISDWSSDVCSSDLTSLGAAEIHRIGREQVADLTSRMDVLLKAQGYTKGSLRDRLNALSKAEGQLFANDDAGRAEMLAYLNEIGRASCRERVCQYV